MSALEYKKDVWRVMDLAISAGEPSEFSQEDLRLLKHAVENQYIEGIELVEMISGRIVCEIRHGAKITLKGLEFLDDLKKANKGAEAQYGNQKEDSVKKSLNFFKRIPVWVWNAFVVISVVVGFVSSCLTIWRDTAFVHAVFSLLGIS